MSLCEPVQILHVRIHICIRTTYFTSCKNPCNALQYALKALHEVRHEVRTSDAYMGFLHEVHVFALVRAIPILLVDLWPQALELTSGQVQLRKSAFHGLPVTLRMLRAESDKCDWFWSQSIVFPKPFKTGMSLDGARGRDPRN